jgi:hypothetical protein
VFVSSTSARELLTHFETGQRCKTSFGDGLKQLHARIAGKPRLEVLLIQDHRHSVVHLCNEGIGLPLIFCRMLRAPNRPRQVNRGRRPVGVVAVSPIVQRVGASQFVKRIEIRWAIDIDRIRAYTAEWSPWLPALIVAVGTPIVDAVHKATRSIPVVFVLSNDPVGMGQYRQRAGAALA